MKTVTMFDVSLDLNTIHVLCDTALSYAVLEANDDPKAVNKLTTLLLVITEKVEMLENAVDNGTE